MYDTLYFWVDVLQNDTDPFAVAQYLDNVTERHNDNSGYSCSGNCRNYIVSCFQSGISLKGSLAKFYLPSNVCTLTRQLTEEAIECISDNLHLDMKTAKVTRLDIATAIQTKRKPSDYLSYLGNKPYFNRVRSTKDTLYYNTNRRQLCFYDKAKEATRKGGIIPNALTGCNLLRYELRLLKDIQNQLQAEACINGALLYDRCFYTSIVQKWKIEFESINKLKTGKYMINRIKTPKDAETALFAYLLQQGQNEGIIETFVNDLKASKTFADPKSYSRLKSVLNKLLQLPTMESSDLITELQTAINDIAKYSR